MVACDLIRKNVCRGSTPLAFSHGVTLINAFKDGRVSVALEQPPGDTVFLKPH